MSGCLTEVTDATGLMHGFLSLKTLTPSEGMQAFRTQVSDYSKSIFNIALAPDEVDLTYSVALHNSIMMYAHAATKVLEDGGDLTNGQLVTNAVRSTRIEGVDKRAVVLDEHGDRIETYELVNYIWEQVRMRQIPVGKFVSMEKKYTAYGPKVVWPGDTNQVPRSSVSGAKI